MAVITMHSPPLTFHGRMLFKIFPWHFQLAISIGTGNELEIA